MYQYSLIQNNGIIILFSLCYFRIKSEPLYLTPYIESGNVEEGQEKALVLGLLDGLSYEEQPESYSGFLTVDKNYDSNMFFWFIPATVSKDFFFSHLLTYSRVPSLSAALVFH